MADLSDVVDALGEMAAAALYPGQNPPSGNSIAGVPVLVQSGWPDPASLDKLVKDAAAGNARAQVTVYPRPTERNTTRYPRAPKQTGPLQAKTFTLSVAGQVVTVGGAQPATFYGQNFAVFVNGVAYVYRTVSNDTLAAIAAALAGLIAADVPGTSSTGSAITVPSLARIGALRVGSQAPVAMEVKRQEREFQLIAWAPTPSLRNLVAAPVDVAIALNTFLTFADGTKGRLLYKGSPFTDFDQKVGLYRRDLIVSVEYATLATDTAAEAIAIRTDYTINYPSAVLGTEADMPVSDEGGDELAISAPDITKFT